MNKLRIPERIKEIKQMSRPAEREKAFAALAEELGIAAEEPASTVEETKIVEKLNEAYKAYVTKLSVRIGLVLILLSAVNAFMRSCQTVPPG